MHIEHPFHKGNVPNTCVYLNEIYIYMYNVYAYIYMYTCVPIFFLSYIYTYIDMFKRYNYNDWDLFVLSAGHHTPILVGKGTDGVL